MLVTNKIIEESVNGFECFECKRSVLKFQPGETYEKTFN